MAIYHFSVSTISRSAGRTAPAAAAYRAGERVVDQITGEVHDYTRKAGVESVDMVLPEGAPAWDRSTLWSAAERAEKRRDSCVAREIELALPDELSAEQRRALVLEFARGLSDRHGVAVDVAIHAPGREGDQRNHHAHVLMTTRRLGPEGLGVKTREWDDRKTGPALTVEWRAEWARLQNEALERHGHAARVDHRSLAEQGITDREPGQHDGPARTAVLRKAARKVREAVEHVQRIEAELREAVAEHAGQVAAVAAAAVAVAAPLPAAAVPAPVAVVHQVDDQAAELAQAFAAIEAPQAPQRPAMPADPQPVRAAPPPQTPQGQGPDQSPAQEQAPAPRGAAPAEAPEGPRVVKTAEPPARPIQAEPPQQPTRAQIEPTEPVPVAQTEPQDRQERARSALQRVREASARLKAAEAAKGRAEGALKEARARRAKHWDPEDAGKAEAVAKARAAELAKEYRELKQRIEGRGLLARMAARVSDPEFERLEALWPQVQQARQEATDAATRTIDAKVVNGAAVKASYALRDAGQELQAATKAAQQAVEDARPYQAEIQAVLRQERAEREAAEREAERLAQLDADQAEQERDGWDYEA